MAVAGIVDDEWLTHARSCRRDPTPPRTAPAPPRLQAQLLPRPSDRADADVIKSLVFSADSQPVLVVCGLSSKVRGGGVPRRRAPDRVCVCE